MGQRAVAGLVAFAWAIAVAEEPAYVGSKVCAGCHKQLYDRYTRSAMGRSMAVPSRAVEPATVHHAKLNRNFQVFRQGAEIYQREYETDASGKTVFTTTHKLEYAVGSGVNGFSYIVR